MAMIRQWTCHDIGLGDTRSALTTVQMLRCRHESCIVQKGMKSTDLSEDMDSTEAADRSSQFASKVDYNVEQCVSPQDVFAEPTIVPADERCVLRKIDLIIMPAMTFVYFFQYLDKQTINYASIFGLNKDLGLTGQEFSWVVTIFYFGQLASEFPCLYLMSRFPVTRVVGICM